jgi:hypothetical protein
VNHDAPHSYRVARAAVPPPLTGEWSSAAWSAAAPLDIAHFHPRSSEHRPRTQARLLHDTEGLHVIFRVQDRWVRAVSARFQDPVWADSCVELFVRPRADRGYFNFEMSCGGVLLLYYIEDPTRTADGFVKFTKVEEKHLEGFRVYHSLPQRVEPEIADPVDWVVQYFLPFTLFAPYLGSAPPAAGSTWRANLFKCADECSHPHWASWAPIGEELNFHQPDRFGELVFAP